MNEKMLTEILAAHADHLVQGEARETEYLALFPAYKEELKPLLELARQLKEALVLERPAEAFRRRLHQELVAAARRRRLPPPIVERPRWRRPWVIGIAALGSLLSLASAVGVIAYLRRARAAKLAAATG